MPRFPTTRCPAKQGAASDEAGHWPDPKTFRNPVAVGSGPEDYLLRITCNCVHCGMVGELMVEAPHANIEWEDPEDFDPSPIYPWGNSPPRGNYPADNE